MNILKRIGALCFVLALSVIMLTSCNEKKSEIVAKYDIDKYVYADDADFADFYNLNRYFYSYKSGENEDDIDNAEYNTILSEAVKETIIVRVFEEEIKEYDYSLDMEKIKYKADNDIASFNAAYEGGFEKFCEDWDLSENVFLLYNKYEAMKDIAKNFLEVEITDREAKKYYDENPEKYFKTPHYDISTIYLQLSDPSDNKAINRTYNDAMLYIGMLNSGRSWESIKETAFYKYNEEGMIFTKQLTGLNHVSMKHFLNVIDLETELAVAEEEFAAANGMKFSEMFPGNFEQYALENELKPETKEFNRALEIYMSHASKIFNIEFRYAVKNYWEEGKTYHKPIYHAAYDSFVIVTFTRIEEENVNITFEEAKEEIVEILTETEKEKSVENYISQRMSELKVRIYYK